MESADGRSKHSQVTTRGRAVQLSSKSLRDSHCRRRSQSAVAGDHSPAMRTDAGHTPLKTRRRGCGKKYSERLIT